MPQRSIKAVGYLNIALMGGEQPCLRHLVDEVLAMAGRT